MNQITEQFCKLGNEASFHFADDSTSEWGIGSGLKKKAMSLYWNNPALQDEMETHADFLWSLKGEIDVQAGMQRRSFAIEIAPVIKQNGSRVIAGHKWIKELTDSYPLVPWSEMMRMIRAMDTMKEEMQK